MATPLAAFGPGILIITRTDTTTPIAINVGYVQELTVDFAGTTKQLYGQNQYPLVAARGTIKATGKWKAAVLSGIAWNNAFYGMSAFSTSSANNLVWNIASTFTLSTTATAQNLPSTATFDADLGMIYSTSGIPLQRVTTGLESSGKYSLPSTGGYNFSAADQLGAVNGNTTATTIKLTYTQQSTGVTGQSLIVANQLIGFTPTFQLDYYTNLNQPTAKPFVVRLYSCVASKTMWAPKLEDFILPEFDFDIFANSAGNVVNYVLPEIS